MVIGRFISVFELRLVCMRDSVRSVLQRERRRSSAFRHTRAPWTSALASRSFMAHASPTAEQSAEGLRGSHALQPSEFQSFLPLMKLERRCLFLLIRVTDDGNCASSATISPRESWSAPAARSRKIAKPTIRESSGRASAPVSAAAATPGSMRDAAPVRRRLWAGRHSRRGWAAARGPHGAAPMQ